MRLRVEKRLGMQGSPTSIGKRGEDSYTAELVELLHDRQFQDAIAFPLHHRAKDKPDAQFTNGGLNIISAKVANERTAERTAYDYKVRFLERGTALSEVFAVTYPQGKQDQYHLYVLPSSTHRHGIPLTLDSMDELADSIVDAVRQRIEDLTRAALPPVEVARRKLIAGSLDLADAMGRVERRKLEEVFGGHTFFHNCLELQLESKGQEDSILRQGPAHLFASQLLFYELLAEEEFRASGENETFHPISEADAGSPGIIRAKYFSRVTNLNYQAIYSVDVADLFRTSKAAAACRDLVHAISGLVPRLDTPDLVGQVFQSLIPPEIRKPLGAHYTNPGPARLLARLSINTWDAQVFDPSCGSGTLLVAAYRTKRRLLEQAGSEFTPEHHRRFVEEDLTGIDAMAVAGHLAAVNLAAQEPLTETRHVRIARMDSTRRRPGESIPATGEALREDFRQSSLHDVARFGQRTSPRQRIVQVSKQPAQEFDLRPADIVIMNPPFTSWHNMTREYREGIKLDFKALNPTYRRLIKGKFSQQGFFLILADLFLKEGGMLAAVLPLSTFQAMAFRPLVRYLLENYTIRAFIVGFGRSSFSEDTALSECLLVATKGRAPDNAQFPVVGTLKRPEDWSRDDVELLALGVERAQETPNLAKVVCANQSDLLAGKETFTTLMNSLDVRFDEARMELRRLFQKTRIPLVSWGTLRIRKGLTVTRWVLGSELFGFYGPKALFACRTEQRAGDKKTDRLVYDSVLQDQVRFRDRVTGAVFQFPRAALAPALRTFAYLPSIDISRDSDFVVRDPIPALETLMESMYGRKDAATYLKRIRERTSRYKGGRWPYRVQEGSARVCLGIRFNLAAPGTTVLACRSDSPLFLASFGFMVKGLSDREEKLFCLWVNSTLFLIQGLGDVTVTQGTYAKFEKSFVDKVLFPDFDRLGPEDWNLVEELWSKAAGQPCPSLKEQLVDPTVRSALDDGMLSLLGLMDATERNRFGSTLRAAALGPIVIMEASMRKREKAPSSADKKTGA